MSNFAFGAIIYTGKMFCSAVLLLRYISYKMIRVA